LNKLILILFSIIVLSLANLQDASAAITVFTDKATFLSTTGASSATGPLPDLGLIAGGAAASQTVGSVTFTITPPSSELYIGAAGVNVVPGLDWTAINPGPDIAISDIENLNADLASSVFSLGFDVIEPTTGFGCNNTTCVDSTFSVTLKNGPTTVGSFQFNAPDNVLAFAGVSSTLAFDRVEIREIIGNNDDEYFGEFYTSLPRTAVGGILEPIDTTALIIGYSVLNAYWLAPIGIGIGLGIYFVKRRF